MRKSIKAKLIGILLVLLSLFTLAGCSLNKTLDQILQENGLQPRVTYFANGGMFDGNSDSVTKYLYYKTGDIPLDIPGKDSIVSTDASFVGKGSIQVERAKYVFCGWYEVEVNENEEPVRDDNGNIILGDKFDFNIRLQAEDSYFVAAKWSVKEKLEVVLVTDEAFEATIEKIDAEGNHVLDENGKKVTETKTLYSGNTVQLKDYGTDNTVRPNTSGPITVNGFTFVSYYKDEACTELLPAGKLNKKGDGTNLVIYAKYIKGEWEIVKDASDVSGIFSFGGNAAKKFYLVQDIDCTGKSTSTVSSFKAQIEGNGFTISNLTVKKTGITDNTTHAMFGDISDGAVIRDLTLKEVKVEFETMPACGMVTLYYFACSVSESATIENLKIDGGIASITLTKTDAIVVNMQEAFGNDYFLFGGYNADEEQAYTDEEFLAEHTGVTVVTNPTIEK